MAHWKDDDPTHVAPSGSDELAHGILCQPSGASGRAPSKGDGRRGSERRSP